MERTHLLIAAPQFLPNIQQDDQVNWEATRMPGRVRFELTVLASGQLEVTATRTCDTPVVMAYFNEILNKIIQQWPDAVIKVIQPETQTVTQPRKLGRRGGPIGTPEDQRLEIVREWLRVQGHVNQERYAQSKGISVSTLRRWLHELLEAGKL